MSDTWTPGKTTWDEVTEGRVKLLTDFSHSKTEHKQAWSRIEYRILRAFVAEANRRAELNMLKTGKLEGSHYAAMKQIISEYPK
jgi:hypothetical protein